MSIYSFPKSDDLIGMICIDPAIMNTKIKFCTVLRRRCALCNLQIPSPYTSATSDTRDIIIYGCEYLQVSDDSHYLLYA